MAASTISGSSVRMPGTHDIVTILIELHVKSDGILRATAETVVFGMVLALQASFGRAAPRVYYLLHFISNLGFTGSVNL